MLHLEEVLSELPQVEAPLRHTFGGGVYVRELFIPKGSIIIGKRHRGETMNMMTHGVLALYMGSDESAQIVKAPQTFVSPPFTKKMAIALEDTIFVNIHPTDKTDLEQIEDEFIIKESDYNLLEKGDTLCLGQQ